MLVQDEPLDDNYAKGYSYDDYSKGIPALYWSSSEYSSNYGWSVYFGTGGVSGSDKSLRYRVRFVRDILP
jgi:hypothetical protein